jgi:excisionase family DNA binding protein
MNKKPGTPGRLLTVPEAARVARVSPQTVYRRVATGEIPALRVGDHSGPIRIPRDEFERWLFGESETAA